MSPFSRREFLKSGIVMGAAAAAGGVLGPPLVGAASAATVRRPGSLPFPTLPAGTVDGSMPFDHIVVVMMENHSFDNYLGMLPVAGTTHADGFTFDKSKKPTNFNPSASGKVKAFPFTSTAQGPDVTQTWNATHRQVDGGKMDGFVYGNSGSIQAMGYWGPALLPFAYSFASTFTVGNRWFCSAPCQTYPNRRFLMAGTAYGDITTDSSTITLTPPPNGTIFDQLSAHGVSWRNYYTDLPQTAIIPSIVEKYPLNLSPIGHFFADCALGTLPAVSFVDPEFGVLSDIGAPLMSVPGFTKLGALVSASGGDEEEPQDLAYGENWAYQVVNAVLHLTRVEANAAHLHVRRARRLLRSRATARCNRTRFHPAESDGDRCSRWVQHLRAEGAGDRRVAVCEEERRHQRRTRPHIRARDHRSEMELAALTYRDANAHTVLDFLDLGMKRLPNRRPSRSLELPAGTARVIAERAVNATIRVRMLVAGGAAVVLTLAGFATAGRGNASGRPRRCRSVRTSGTSCWRTRTTRRPSVPLRPIHIWRRRCRRWAHCLRTTTARVMRATTTTSR